MIIFKLRCEIDEMKVVGKIFVDMYKEFKKIIKLGIISWDLEVFIEEFLCKNGVILE